MTQRKLITRCIALGLTAVMVFGIVGCGKTKSNPSSADKSDNGKPFDGVTVKWALTDNAATGSETKEMVELIKEKTGINVEFYIIPTAKAGEMDKVLVSLMAGDEIDILGRTPLQLEVFYQADVLESLDELAKADNYDMSALYGNQVVKFDDKFYAIPAEKDIWLTYYNKKIFDDAKILYPTAKGWTWEKYVETAIKLNDSGKDVWGSFMSDDVACNYMLATQKGIYAYKEDGTANFDNEAYKEAMKWFYSLGNDLKIQPNCLDQASGTYPYNSFMVNGNIGMYVYGGWVASSLSDKEKYPRDWKLGILPMPYPEGYEESSLTITSCYAIPKTSKKKDAAFEAIKTICEYKYTLGYGRVPAKILTEAEARSYIESSLLPKFKDDNLTVDDFMLGWFDNSRLYLSEKIMGTADTTISQIYTEEGQLYGQGQKSLDDTMKAIQDRANKAILEVNK